MVHINKCIKDLLEKGGKKPADEHAAVWVPDAAASTCMRCQKSQFNIINRRVRVFLFLLPLQRRFQQMISDSSTTVAGVAQLYVVPAQPESTCWPMSHPSQ